MPVEAIAEDLLGLHVEEAELGAVSGLLYPDEMRIYLNASDSPARRRFTLAHELGHWVCQCVGRETQPVYCRTVDVTLDPTAQAREREAHILQPDSSCPDRLSVPSQTGGARFAVSDETMSWPLYTRNSSRTTVMATAEPAPPLRVRAGVLRP